MIKVRDNGPDKVSGPFVLEDADGNRYDVAGRPIVLCRCGLSQNKPFCDAAHNGSDFVACERAPQD